ncbi:hypothetical protein FQZ97_485370 [compost metagenome]
MHTLTSLFFRSVVAQSFDALLLKLAPSLYFRSRQHYLYHRRLFAKTTLAILYDTLKNQITPRAEGELTPSFSDQTTEKQLTCLAI